MQILEVHLFFSPQVSFTLSVSSEKGGLGAAVCSQTEGIMHLPLSSDRLLNFSTNLCVWSE